MDDGLQLNNQGFFDERALDDAAAAGTPEYCRLPSDELPYPAEEEATSSGECFACTYGAKFAHGGTAKNSKHIYDDMMNIITSMYGKTSNATLVTMVHAFYEQEIRKYFTYPPWSKRSIWEHIYMHSHDEHIQTSEAVQTLTAAIEVLRSRGLCQRVRARGDGDGDGEPTPGDVQIDHKNARLYMDMLKTRDALIANRLKRKAAV